MVVGPPGGNTDFTARIVGQGISPALGQSVVVDNRSSITIAEIVAKAAPDGYTLLLTGNITWLAPLMQKTPYDPRRDFAPITLAVTIVILWMLMLWPR